MPKKGDRREKDGKNGVWHHELGWIPRAEESDLSSLLDSYANVLLAQVAMDFSKTCDRDWKNLQTLLVEKPEIGERTISYLINALQDAAEKRMTSRAEHNARSPRKDTSVIKAVDYDGKVGFHYVVVDDCIPIISDFICGLEGADLRSAVWHREHGWLPKTCAPVLKEVEAFSRAVNASWGIPRRRPAVAFGAEDIKDLDDDLPPDDFRRKLEAFDPEQDQMSPGSWTTLPEDLEGDDWMFDVTDPEDKMVIASADTQTDGTKVCVVEININGVTRTVCAPETTLRDFERDLDRLQEMCRAYL